MPAAAFAIDALAAPAPRNLKDSDGDKLGGGHEVAPMRSPCKRFWSAPLLATTALNNVEHLQHDSLPITFWEPQHEQNITSKGLMLATLAPGPTDMISVCCADCVCGSGWSKGFPNQR